jgi:hypothetical protein
MPNINAATKTTSVQLKEGAAPSTPASGFGRLFVNSSGVLQFINDAGTTLSLVDALTAAGIGTSTGISSVQISEGASPGIPASGFGRLWVDTSGVLNFTNDGGTTVQLAVSSSTVKMAVGSYTGNGGATQAITGLGFQPTFMWILDTGGGIPIWKTSLDGVNAGITNGQYGADLIISLNADGFTVGDNTIGYATNPNINTRAYRYAAWRQS